MKTEVINQRIVWLLLIGTPLTSLFLLTSVVTDPVNQTKMVCLVATAFGALSILLSYGFSNFLAKSKILILTTILFIAAMLNAILNSRTPFVQNWYGDYGRNTGFLTYFSLAVVFLAAASIMTSRYFDFFVRALFFTGFVNVIYCGWVLLFGDFIPWNNPYGNILGLLGNPDFISAFLGIFLVCLFSYFADRRHSIIVRVSVFVIGIVTFLEIVKSHAIQGVVISLGGLGLLVYFKIRTHSILSRIYLILFNIIGLVAIFGSLEHGPLSFIHKRSVSLRGSYWQSGFKMGFENLWTGVGMDSYGDSYRLFRSDAAVKDLPGAGIVSNAAHNVIIDMFAFGGFPLLAAYTFLNLLVIRSGFKYIRRNRNYDPVFTSIFLGWVCYHVQSIISINQVGLAIWGWLLGGLIIAMERTSGETAFESPKKARREKSDRSNELISPTLIGVMGALLGIFLASPYMNSDMRWFAAIKSQKVEQVRAALSPDFFHPISPYRYTEAVQLFLQNGLEEDGHRYALIAVKQDPDNFIAWKQLYFAKNSTKFEKEKALSNMKRLDPKNPDVTTN